mgnify:CR=1 FL=1
MRFLTCGADGILVELADLDETLRVFAALQSAVKHAVEQTAESPERAAQPSTTSVFAGVKQLIPAARTVYVAFDPLLSSRVELTAAIRALNVAADMERHSRIVEIPVIYDGEDMADVADLLGISVDEVVRRHCDTAWSVAFVGFAPGFAYLTGGDPIFDVPRRKVPRLSVPAGAVGLAGTFSGVYPRVSSGGWQLLGHTETPMWDERADPPALLQPGDTVRFTPVRDAVSGGSASVSASVSDSVQVSQAPDSMSVSASSPALEVLRSGLLTTFQDDGRVAANMGVTGSGAAELRRFIGPAIIESLRRNHVPAEDLDRAVDIYRSYYGDRAVFDDPNEPGNKVPGRLVNVVFPGIREQLLKLHADGYYLALASCKPEYQCMPICDHFHLTELLDGIYGASKDNSRLDKDQVIRYCFDKIGFDAAAGDRAVMIGDRYTDIDGAHACNLDAIGCRWGYAPAGEMEEHGAYEILEKPEQIEEAVNRYFQTH